MATRRRRRFTADFKKRVALEALQGDRTVQEIATRHEVHPNQVSTWKRQAIDGLDEVFGGGKASRQSEHDATLRDLHAKSRAERQQMVDRDDALSISRQCALLSISRSSVYYRPRGESAESLALMRRMDALSLEYPFYGSRQMALHLRREGVSVGRRRVRRLMRLMGRRRFYRKPRTSDAQPGHRVGHRVYPYLLRGLTTDRLDQVWCVD